MVSLAECVQTLEALASAAEPSTAAAAAKRVAATPAAMAEEQALRRIVKKARVCITTAGPFEKYGKTLAKLCAEEGVHYCDITGESDFVRHLIKEHDSTARKTGACIVAHCGNDCVPWDLTVLKLHEEAVKRNLKLTQVDTYTELPPSFAASGGAHSASYFNSGGRRDAVDAAA